MLEILDAVIATAAVTLSLSLVVQAIQQIFKQMFDLKSSYMRTELLALFADDDTAASLQSSWIANFVPLRSLAEKADAVAKRIVRELEARMSTFGLTDLHLLEGVDTTTLKEILISLPIAHDASVRDKFDKALARIDLWIDISKKAFQEHYERRMKIWAFGISAVVVVALNANIFDIYTEFSHNKPLRETAIALGQRFVSMPRDSLIITPRSITADSQHVGTNLDSLRVVEIKKQLGLIQSIIDEESFQVMGWTKARLDKYRGRPWQVNAVLMLVGWVGMTLLVSLGAPFWYDFLKTMMGVKDRLKGSLVQKETAPPPPANQVSGSSPDIPPVG